MSTNIYSIYKITNEINLKKYIGYSKQVEKRIARHKYIYKSGNNLLYKSMKKYGIDNFTFEVIYQSLDEKHCFEEMETYFIKENNSFYLNGSGYNLTIGGNFGGYKHKKKSLQKLSKKLKGRFVGNKNPFYGKNHSDEFKKKIGIVLKKANTGKKQSESHKIKKVEKIKEYYEKYPEKRWRIQDWVVKNRSCLWEVSFPNGKKQIIENLRDFCRNNNLSQSAMCRTSGHNTKYKQKAHKGYSCKMLEK